MSAPAFNEPDFQHDLYANYRRLRESDPVHYNEFGGVGRYALFRYEDVATAFRDPRLAVMGLRRPIYERLVASGNPELEALGRMAWNFILLKDPPDHGRLRGMVQNAFTPRVIEGLRERVTRRVHAALDGVAERGGLDLVADLAVPVPLFTIAELLGVPTDEHRRLKAWSGEMAPILDRTLIGDRLGQAARAMAEARAYFRALVEQRRADPGDDLLSLLIAVRDEGSMLSEDELLANCLLVLSAGHETVTNLIGNGALALLQHPEQQARLRADPGCIRSAVEELLRYEPPVQRVPRTASETLELGGQTIAANTPVDLVVASANRDPERFSDPDRFDVLREDNRHLSFGAGIHFCIGGSLARLEAQVTLGAFFERFPAAKLATGTPAWHPGSTFRGLRALPLVV